jgi:hypothetical protein
METHWSRILEKGELGGIFRSMRESYRKLEESAK